MTSPPGLTLMAFFGMGAVQQVAKTRLFGGPYLRFCDFVNVSAYLYQSGALLARAMNKLDKLTILAKMFSEPGRERDVINWLQDLAKNRLDEYVDTFGQQPTSLLNFVLATEYKKVGIIFPFDGAGTLTNTHMKQVSKVADSKMVLNDVEPAIKNSMLEGIGFGSSFSALTERMYREANEEIDIDQWSEWRGHGLNIPETPTVITLEEQEQLVLSMVATYAHTHFPELIEPLGLIEDSQSL